MNRILSSHIRRTVCTKGRLALTLTLTLVALFTTAGVLAKDYSFAGGGAAGVSTSFMTSLSSVPSIVTARFFNSTSVTAPQSLTATPLPGICSNSPTTACSVNTDCPALPAGGICKIPTAGGDLTPNTKCLAQASGIAGGCTANDVSVAQTTSLRVEDRDPITPGVQGCLQPGDTATVSFVAQFHSTATARYDVGVWTSQNGGSALTGADGTCSVADFPSSPTPPWFNQEASIPTDVCGDISSSADVYSSINNIQVACIDTNGDGNLDINTCLSWGQTATKKAADACTTPIQATAGTTSKCNCGQLPGIAILVPGKIRVDKVTKDPNGNPSNDPTLFNFTISGSDGDLPDNFQLANATAVHESPSLNAAAGNGTQYAVTEQSNTSYSTTATCVSDQSVNGVPRPAQNPFAGNGMVTLHAGETLTCTYTNRLIDLCAGVTCATNTACASYACDGADGVCKPTYQPATTACGSASDTACDNPDHCSGTDGSCVANNEPTTKACGDADGACTNADFCNGTGSCTDNGFKSAATACGSASDTACDNPDHCSGTNGSCVANNEPTTTACGDPDGACTNADFCNGTGSCTDNGFKSAATACGSASDTACDNPDHCSGTDGSCLANNEPTTTACGDAAGACTNPDFCNGAGGCTDNGFKSAATACGSASDTACDNPDHCSGTDASCVPNNEPATTQCRADNGTGCDVAENCDGAGSCPADAFKSAGTLCGDGTNTVCDNPDTCNAGGQCANDNNESTSVVCRPETGACDVAENCDGGGNCPTDVVDTPPTVTLGLNLLCENPNPDGPEQGGATPTQLVATVNPGGSYSFSWTGPDGQPILDGQGQPITGNAITPTKPGTYTVVVTDTATSCPNDAAFKLCFTGEQVDVASVAPTEQSQVTASFTIPARSEPTGFRVYLAKLLVSVFG